MTTTRTHHSLTTDAKARTITEDFRILDTEQRDKYDRAQEWATLRVKTTHYPEHKRYVSRVTRAMVNDRGGYRTSFDLMDRTADPAPAVGTPATRYNAKTLREVHEAYMVAHLSSAAQIEAALEWARGAVNA